jgi:hypothetical protein
MWDEVFKAFFDLFEYLISNMESLLSHPKGNKNPKKSHVVK